MYMKKITFYLIFLQCLLFWGCTKTYYHNPVNADASWEHDSLICKQYAQGTTPMPVMKELEQGRTTYGSGTVNFSDGSSAFVTYNETTQPDGMKNFAIGMENLANAIGTQAVIQNKYRDCLASLGWKNTDDTVKEHKAQAAKVKDLYSCFQTEANKAATTTDDFERLISIVQAACIQYGSGERPMAAYYSRQALDAKKK